MAVREEIVAAIAEAIRRLGWDGERGAIVIERPREAAHGDLSTPVAMSFAKKTKQNPLALAEKLAAALQLPGEMVSSVEAVRPGFVNFRLALPVLQRTVHAVLAEGDAYGTSREGEGRKVQVEYVSANPTGPLVIVSARAASVGNCLLNLLHASGYETHGEYYVNDYGKQVEALGESLRFRVKERLGAVAPGESIENYQYPGAYLSVIASEADEASARRWLDPAVGSAELGRHASGRLLDSIRADMRDFGARFDDYFLESSLHPGAVRTTYDRLVAGGHTYEQDGAVFFRSTAFGDDKDRVIRKADGESTYFLADVAYHTNKLARGFDRAIGLLGPDHHGHVPRMQAAMAALADGGVTMKDIGVLAAGGVVEHRETRVGTDLAGERAQLFSKRRFRLRVPIQSREGVAQVPLHTLEHPFVVIERTCRRLERRERLFVLASCVVQPAGDIARHRYLRIVPFGDFHIFFRPNSFTRASSGVMVAHLTPTPCFLMALAASMVTWSPVASRCSTPRS